VRKHREAAGISQERLADLAGIHRTYIGDVERGERNLGLVNIYRIATALNMTVGELSADMDIASRS
jgi:transcriptional regulator with XRE-family HTH domain